MEPTVRVPSAPPTHLRVPPELEGLRRLAYNLYWTWHPRARGLYARIDSGAWARSHSPIPVLIVHTPDEPAPGRSKKKTARKAPVPGAQTSATA